MITLKTDVSFYTNDSWTCDNFEFIFDDHDLNLIKKARELLIKNKDFEKIVLRFDGYKPLFDDYDPDDIFQDLRIDVALLYVYTSGIVFYCQSKYDSGSQMESDWIEFNELNLN